MVRIASIGALAAVLTYALPQTASAEQAAVEDLAGLVGIYKQIHANPELSHAEVKTAALLAGELRKAGYTVTEHVGKYPDGSAAHGVVAIMENGPGPRLLIRADMDALPIVEETGLPWASHERTKNAAGQDVGVMHACGHDVHVATLIGTARALAAARKNWHGTLMLVGQPAEESIDGAKAMLADGLYERFGRPDMAIALHDTNGHAAGTVGITSGPTQAGVNSIDVTLRGIGGHGAAPQDSIDPVVMAGQFLVQLQTIVSRMQNPRDPTVITVGSIHGGTRRNIIPYEVKMELTSRFFSEQASQTILDGVRRVAQSVALAAGAPADRQPIVTVIESESAPLTYNNPALAARVKAALVKSLGTDNVFDDEPVMYSEDFGFFGLPGLKIPSVIFGLGAVDPAAYAAARAAGKQVPGPHTSRWAPVPEATLGTGVRAMTAVAIALLQK